MIQRRTLGILVGVVAVAAGVVLFCGGDRSVSAKVYCNPDGRLTSSAPVLSHRSYCVRSFTQIEKIRRAVPADFEFDMVDDRGETLREFAIVHEKIMHVIVVRHDLTQFQHLHPTFSKQDGRFTVADLVVPVDGPYRLFADFTPAGAQRGPAGEPLPVTRSIDLSVGDQQRYAPEALPEPVDSVTIGAYEVAFTRPDTLRAGEEADLTFTIRLDGKVVDDLEPYLGANGHAVILRAGDLAFLHSHALEDKAALRAGILPFMVHFSEPGRYRAFVQFQHRRVVHTASFTLPAVLAATSSSGIHSGH